MKLVQRISDLIVIIASTIGLLFSFIGLIKISEDKLLFYIFAVLSLSALMLSIIDLFIRGKDIIAEKIYYIITIVGGVTLIIISFIILFVFKDSSLFIKSIAIFSIIFFSIGIIKTIKK